jgi:hypothetical protein
MTLTYKAHTDSGSPKFEQVDGDYQITCKPGDRGRWLATYQDPLEYNQKLTLRVSVRTQQPDDVCSSVIIIWWKNEPGYVFDSADHVGEECGRSGEFKNFVHHFSVPANIKELRIDLRAWAGAGTSIFKDISIQPTIDPPPDPPDEVMMVMDFDFIDMKWRVSATRDAVTALRIPALEEV